MFIWDAHGCRLHESPHSPEWAHHGIVAAPVATGPVLSRAKEILASPVVGVLVEDPVTLHDVAGENVTVAEAVIHVGAVIHKLHWVSHHVWPVVDPHPVGSPILHCERKQGNHDYYVIFNRCNL